MNGNKSWFIVDGYSMTLVMGSPNVHWKYRHIINGREFLLDTDETVSYTHLDVYKRQIIDYLNVNVY